jgi:hypothetical protein
VRLTLEIADVWKLEAIVRTDRAPRPTCTRRVDRVLVPRRRSPRQARSGAAAARAPIWPGPLRAGSSPNGGWPRTHSASPRPARDVARIRLRRSPDEWALKQPYVHNPDRLAGPHGSAYGSSSKKKVSPRPAGARASMRQRTTPFSSAPGLPRAATERSVV